jgi:hypothetical protein
MWKTETLYMRWCLDCHNDPAPHLRPHEQVFTMRDFPEHRLPADPNTPEAARLRNAHLDDCSICHR